MYRGYGRADGAAESSEKNFSAFVFLCGAFRETSGYKYLEALLNRTCVSFH